MARLGSTSSPRTILLLLCLLVASIHFSCAVKWLALADHEPKLHWNSTKMCKKAKGLVSSQIRLCRRNLDAMEGLEEAAALTKATCQEQFADRRWNCSSIENAPDYSPDIDKGTRESAYVYALSAAAVAYSIAIECSSGVITKCGCGRPTREEGEDFRWGGCSDNVEYGMDFSSRFADAPLRIKKARSTEKSLMNLHNNFAGLLTVKTSMKMKCKCHGISGACNLKTCWQSLPEMDEIGSKLKRKYAGATEVMVETIGNKNNLVPRDRHFKGFTEDDLIYLQRSPDYCMWNPSTGSLGTVGRFCNRSSIGNDGCELMCCGRGYKSLRMEIVEQCQCRYHWCCYVKCKECKRTVDVQICK